MAQASVVVVMTQQAIVAETLRAWREAERVLETLPPLSPDHETVARTLLALRRVYAELTESKASSNARLDQFRNIVDESRRVIEAARGRIGGNAGA